jgi:hypothetical protein
MPERDDEAFEAYWREVAAGLRGVPEAARDEILRELRAHLDDARAAGQPVRDRAAIVGILGPARRLGWSLALARRGQTRGDMVRRIVFGLARWAVAAMALLVAALFAALLLAGVPAATPDNLIEIAGSYAGSTIPTEPERDLLIDLGDRAATFRVNDDRVPEVASAALLADLRPGDRVYLTVYKRFLPGDPAARGIVPIAAIRTDSATYLALPAGGGVGAAPPYSAAIIALSLLLALACAWPDLRALVGGSWAALAR